MTAGSGVPDTQTPLITDAELDALARDAATRGILITYANTAEVDALAEHLREQDRDDHCGLIVEGADGPALDAMEVARVALQWLTKAGGYDDVRRARWVAEALDQLADEPAWALGAYTAAVLRELAAEYRDGRR